VLLAIDSSAGTSVAVVDREGGILSERAVLDTRSHAEVIGRLIQEALAEAGTPIEAMSGVALGMGPGPFTGLRVGIAAGRVAAFALGKPVVPIVSHDAIAYAEYVAGRTGPLTVVTDARRREVYWSSYSGADELGLPIRMDGPALEKPAAFDGQPNVLDAATVSAGALGMLAEFLYIHKRPFAENSPLYLRAPDVTLSAPKRVTG
jgi:tRNA threonylcarbamoyl adenosine modification protein YeaZ